MNSNHGTQDPSRELIPYLSLYGLHEMPFTSAAEGPYFYESSDLSQHHNLILHLLQSTQLILAVIGNQGMGKSSLLTRLLSRPPENLQPYLIKASTTTDADVLLKNLARQFNLPTDCGKVALLHLLDEEARKLGRQDTIPTLFIDDAHLLHPSAIELLLQLAQGTGEHRIPWHITLFAEPALGEHLAKSGVQLDGDARIYVIELSPLTESQTAGYLQQRMSAAGLAGELPLQSEDIVQIHKSSRGIPAEINNAAHLLLMKLAGDTPLTPAETPATDIIPPAEPMPQQEVPEILAEDAAAAKPRGKGLPWKGFFLGMAVITVLAAGLLLEDKINTLFTPPTRNSETTTMEPVPLPPLTGITVPDRSTAPEIDTGLDDALLATDTTLPPGERDFVAQTHSTTVEREETPSPDRSPASNPDQQPETGADDHPVPPEPAHAPIPIQSSAHADKVSGAEQPPAQASRPRPPAPTPAPAAHIATIKADERMHDSAWLLAQSSSAYTLQLLASREQKNISSLLNSSQLDEALAAVYQAQRNQQKLYILLYGVYPDADHAKQAIAELPAAVRKLRPWKRPLSQVQEEIRSTPGETPAGVLLNPSIIKQ